MRTTPPSQCNTIVFAGFISPAKGLDVLADAWESIGLETNMRLHIVGDYDRQHAAYAEGIRARLKAYDSSVTWSGWINDDDAFSTAIADAAIVVLPYRRSNPVSGILIRAAVDGRAIVGSSVPAIADFLVDGVTALIVEPDDAVGLGQALLDLASDRTAQDTLGRAVGLWAAVECTKSAQMDHLMVAYRV